MAESKLLETSAVGRHILRLAAVAAITVSATATSFARDAATGEAETEALQPPLQLMVSLTEQRISVYRGTELVTTSPISSGKRGYSTPTGIFSILEKRRRHYSNLYNNAPMPYMQRLTWTGVAMHQGRLPGYPASHGCIRLPQKFAKSLFSMTDRGAHVVVTKAPTQPNTISHDLLPQPAPRKTEVASLSTSTMAIDPGFRGGVQPVSLEPEISNAVPPNPEFDKPLRMIISPQQGLGTVRVLQKLLNDMGFEAGPVDGIAGKKTRAAIMLFQEGAEMPITGTITDELVARIHTDAGYEEPKNATIRIRRNFKDVYKADVEILDLEAEIGTHIFTALNFEEGDVEVDWMAVSAEGERGGSPTGILDRIKIPEDVQRDLARMLTPGSSLTVTDRNFWRNTGPFGTDFVVVTR